MTEDERRAAFRAGMPVREIKGGLGIVEMSTTFAPPTPKSFADDEARELRVKVQGLEVQLANERLAKQAALAELMKIKSEDPLALLNPVTPAVTVADRQKVPANLRLNQQFWLTRQEEAILAKLASLSSKQKWLRDMIVGHGRAQVPGAEREIYQSEIGPVRTERRKPGRRPAS